MKLVACNAATVAGSFGPKKLTWPLLSSGRIFE